MNFDLILFGIFPYVALALAVIVSIYRYKTRRFSYSSLSSQLLESRALFWGSIPFHWGIVLILTMHLLAFLVPPAVLAWNAVPARLYMLEATGLALGLWSLGGLLVLLWRRMSVPRVQAVSTGMDFVVLLVVLTSVVTGVLTALTYRWGSSWYASVAAPYLWSVVFLQPKFDLIAQLPFLVKLHAFNFFVLLAVFPFSRLVHVVTWPVWYMWRPWQIVHWNRHPGAHLPVASLKPGATKSKQTIHRPVTDGVSAQTPQMARVVPVAAPAEGGSKTPQKHN